MKINRTQPFLLLPVLCLLAGTSGAAEQYCRILEGYVYQHINPDAPRPADDDPELLDLLDRLSRAEDAPNPMPVTHEDVMATFDSHCGDDHCQEFEQGHPCTFHNDYRDDWRGIIVCTQIGHIIYPLCTCNDPSGCYFSSTYPLDIVPNAANEWDTWNNIPLNPRWRWQRDGGQCPNATSETTCTHVGTDKTQPQYWSGGARPCISQPFALTWDEFTSCPYGGHVNWISSPVAMWGTVTWRDHSTGPFSDDDYNLNLTRPGNMGLCTVHNTDNILMEFDSDETVDHWDPESDWWHTFHRAVDFPYFSNNPPLPLAPGINGKTAFGIGLAGLDWEHPVASELHPLYVLAIHNQDNLADDQWSFFARNWGDEGACSDDDWIWNQQTIKIFLPRSNATRVRVTEFNVGHPGVETWDPPQFISGPTPGTLLTFHLPPPGVHGWVVGDIKLDWTAPQLTTSIVAGQGRVNSFPSGIACAPTCSATFAAGSTVGLVAIPDSGWAFDHWSDACSGSSSCNVLMNGDKSVGASFHEIVGTCDPQCGIPGNCHNCTCADMGGLCGTYPNGCHECCPYCGGHSCCPPDICLDAQHCSDR